MDSLTATAASGLRARMESLDLLANNVANASTDGYKADREFYSLYVAPEARDNNPNATMPVIEKPWLDLSQGDIHSTGGPLDVALTGKGFFSVKGPSGPLYTRNGNFRLGADGRLVTSDGYAVQTSKGAALTLQPSRPIEVSSNGTVTQDGAVIGQLDVEQGKLESSNSGAAQAAVRLIGVMRQFEMLQKALTLGNEMNRRAVEEVAKVG
jgi:flagellar basal-body rod protein FlgF